MGYEDALKRWGKRRLDEYNKTNVDVEDVVVTFDYDEGYACCGGRDPECYCSFAESPSFNVNVRGGGGHAYGDDLRYSMDEFLRQLLEEE